MRILLYTLLSVVVLLAEAQASQNSQPLQWVFLKAGAARDTLKEMAKEEATKMQAAHVGNFGNLFDQGRLLTAGPLGDNGVVRGIVVLTATNAASARECFREDPLVQNNLLETEIHPWNADIMSFGSPRVPFQIIQHTIAIVQKGPHWGSAKMDLTENGMFKLFPALKAKAQSGELAISGPFLDNGDKLGVLVFHSTNLADLRAWIAKEPALRHERVRVELHPQFLGAGTFVNRKISSAPPKPGKQTGLFDGKSFKGWEGDKQTWRIASGALVGGKLTQKTPHNEFLSTTKEFKNFDLRLKVKLTGTGFVNGGIQFRSQRCTNPANEMTGYQADMGPGYWGSLYDESRRNKTLAHPHAAIISRILKSNDWNDYIIRCEDRHVRLWLNGLLTVDYTEQDASIPLSGLIGLQIHGGGPAEASYRDIAIAELP